MLRSQLAWYSPPHSAALFYKKRRKVILYYLEKPAHEIFGEIVELDESYFGSVSKGKREWEAAGKVYTQVI